MCVGINIGGSLFALTGIAADLTGPSLPLAMAISSIPILLALVPYSMFTKAWATTSATYRYSQLFNPTVAAVSMLSLLVAILIGGQPLFAFAFGIYFAELIPASPILVGVLLLTAFYIINLLGIRFTSKIQNVLFLVLLSALLLYVVLGVRQVSLVNFSNPFPAGMGGLFAAAGLLYTFSAGGLFVIDLGGEVIKAEKNYSKALFLGILTAVVLYLLIHVVTIGVSDWSILRDKTLVVIANNFMSPISLVYFIVGGALVASATTVNIIFAVVSRGIMVVSEDGLLPAFLGKVNKRFATPHWGLTASYLLCVLSIVTIPSLMFFGSMLNLGLVFSITVVCLAAAAVPVRFPELYKRSGFKMSGKIFSTICYTVVVLNVFIFLFLCMAIGMSAVLFMGIVFASYLFYLSRTKIIKEKGRDVIRPF